MRTAIWLVLVLLFSVSANTEKNTERLLEIDLSKEIVCSSSSAGSVNANESTSLTIYPKTAPTDGWFKSSVSIVKESSLLHEFTMKCKVQDFIYFCYWDMYYHVVLDLEKIWVEKISPTKKVSHFNGVWQEGAFAQGKTIYCSQIK